MEIQEEEQIILKIATENIYNAIGEKNFNSNISDMEQSCYVKSDIENCDTYRSDNASKDSDSSDSSDKDGSDSDSCTK